MMSQLMNKGNVIDWRYSSSTNGGKAIEGGVEIQAKSVVQIKNSKWERRVAWMGAVLGSLSHSEMTMSDPSPTWLLSRTEWSHCFDISIATVKSPRSFSSRASKASLEWLDAGRKYRAASIEGSGRISADPIRFNIPQSLAHSALTYSSPTQHARSVTQPRMCLYTRTASLANMKIEDRTFIVSGGSSGLGFATACLLLSQNANVSILDLNPPQQSSAPSAISDPTRTLFTPTNVSSTPSISSAISSTLTWVKSTSKPLAGVICCAGIGAPALALPRQPALISDDWSRVKMMDMTHFDHVLAVNLRGTVDLIRQTLPHLTRNEPEGDDGERGVVIIVSSVAAYEGQVGQLAYSASKGAVASLVLPLAREVGQKAGIRVMGIAPGLFETGMTITSKKQRYEKEGVEDKMKDGGVAGRAGFNPNTIEYPTRMGRSDEFARLVKEILENAMLNGQVLRLDGAVRMPSRL